MGVFTLNACIVGFPIEELRGFALIDIVDPAKRSKMMSGIQGKNTKPEIAVRKYLHANGFRFRLHRTDLPGRPDLVLGKYRTVIFVHGCFWHRHKNCVYATSPATRQDFWRQKLGKNVARDALQIKMLLESNWRVLTIWECGLKHCAGQMGEIKNHILGDSSMMVWPEYPPKEFYKI